MSRLLDVEKGLKELREKQMIEIERATALTWGGRAAASYRLAMEETKLGERVRHLYEGENYRQEALEHAAMTEDIEFYREIAQEIEEHRKEALVNIQDLLTQSSSELNGETGKGGDVSSRRVQRPGGKYKSEEPPVSTGAKGGPAGVRGEKYESGRNRRGR